jgi:hypothetical protein
MWLGRIFLLRHLLKIELEEHFIFRCLFIMRFGGGSIAFIGSPRVPSLLNSALFMREVLGHWEQIFLFSKEYLMGKPKGCFPTFMDNVLGKTLWNRLVRLT